MVVTTVGTMVRIKTKVKVRTRVRDNSITLDLLAKMLDGVMRDKEAE
jgi:hypothetical protein